MFETMLVGQWDVQKHRGKVHRNNDQMVKGELPSRGTDRYLEAQRRRGGGEKPSQERERGARWPSILEKRRKQRQIRFRAIIVEAWNTDWEDQVVKVEVFRAADGQRRASANDWGSDSCADADGEIPPTRGSKERAR